jgi:hypothetical protein
MRKTGRGGGETRGNVRKSAWVKLKHFFQLSRHNILLSILHDFDLRTQKMAIIAHPFLTFKRYPSDAWFATGQIVFKIRVLTDQSYFFLDREDWNPSKMRRAKFPYSSKYTPWLEMDQITRSSIKQLSLISEIRTNRSNRSCKNLLCVDVCGLFPMKSLWRFWPWSYLSSVTGWRNNVPFWCKWCEWSDSGISWNLKQKLRRQ